MEKWGDPGIDKGKKKTQNKSEVSHIVQPNAHSALAVYGSHTPLARHVW